MQIEVSAHTTKLQTDSGKKVSLVEVIEFIQRFDAQHRRARELGYSSVDYALDALSNYQKETL